MTTKRPTPAQARAILALIEADRPVNLAGVAHRNTRRSLIPNGWAADVDGLYTVTDAGRAAVTRQVVAEVAEPASTEQPLATTPARKPTRAQANAIRWAARIDHTIFPPRGDVLDKVEAAGWVTAEDRGGASLHWSATAAGLAAIGARPEDAGRGHDVEQAHVEARMEDALRTNRREREAGARIAPDMMRRSGRTDLPAPTGGMADGVAELRRGLAWLGERRAEASADLVAEVAPAPLTEEVPAATIATREAWLTGAVDALRPIFAEHSATIPAVRVSVGWPGVSSRKGLNKVIGQCWASHTTADKTPQVFVSPVLADAGQVLETLAHELIHAWDDCKSGHKGDFRKLAKRIGLTGKMTSTVAGDDLKAKLDEIAAQLGPYPHARLSAGDRAGQGEKKQTTRMIKCECACGYLARTSRKWLDEVGAPICPRCQTEMPICD